MTYVPPCGQIGITEKFAFHGLSIIKSIQVLFQHTDIGKNFFNNLVTKEWNLLPETDKSAVTISVFKKRLDVHIESKI